jgi:hypothetical protein
VFFQRGEADFFIAWMDGQPVGTICAAEDATTRAQRASVFGFSTSSRLHRHGGAACAEEWVQARGLTPPGRST